MMRHRTIAALLLAPALLAGAREARAQAAAADSVGSIYAYVTAGQSVNEILERASINCGDFNFNELAARLADKRPKGLIAGLKAKCTKFVVSTDPSNSPVKIGERALGTVGAIGDAFWVNPATQVAVTVGTGDKAVVHNVDLPRGKVVRATFSVQRDTLPWPAARSTMQVAEELGLFKDFTPSSQRPAAPVKPSTGSSFASGLLWGLIGGAGGYAAATFVPSFGCVVKETVPSGQTWSVNGKRYSAGQTVDRGHGAACQGVIAGGSGLGLMSFAIAIKTGKNHGRMSKYDAEQKAYPTLVKDWEQREKQKFADANPQVRSEVSNDQIRLRQVQSDNRSILAKNNMIASTPPRFAISDLTASDDVDNTEVSGIVATSLTKSDVDSIIPKGDISNPDAIAIVIGNKQYRGRAVPNVEFAVNDAVTMKDYLVKTMGFDPKRVILDTNITSGRFREIFGTPDDPSAGLLSDYIKARPGQVDVFVFYSGHGAPNTKETDGNGSRPYLIPVDANPDRLSATAYPLDVLYKNLAALGPRSVIMAIDACFSGASSEGKRVFEGREVSDVLPKVKDARLLIPNASVFTAVTGEETAKWYRDKGHGLFTYFFLKGLSGEADLAGDHDGTVTVQELGNFLTKQVPTYALENFSGHKQNPQLVSQEPTKVLTKLVTDPSKQ